MKFPSAVSYFAGPILGYAAKFAFKRDDAPFSLYFHCDHELTVRVSALNVTIALDISRSCEQFRRDDVYFD